MTLLPPRQPMPLPEPAELLAAAASAAGIDPKALAAANTLLDLAKQLHGGDSSAALASVGAALLAQAPPKVAMALDLFQKASEFSAHIPGCSGGVGIADHPQCGQLPLDFCSPIPTFMPCGVNLSASSAPVGGIKFDDKNRLLRFYSPLSGDKTLLIDSFKGTAALSKPFHFTLQLLSENACIPLKEMIAQNVTVAIRLADGSDSYINGYVESFGYVRADGGFAFYEAEVVSWFSFLDKRVNSRIYQDMTVLGVIESVFADYKQIAKYAFRTSESYEPESYIVQYDETDEHFVSRLLEKNGLFYYFEHSVDGHVMVISDDSCNSRFCPPLAAHPEVEFNAGNRAQREDGVTAFAARRRLHASRVTLNTFDFKSLHGQRIIEGDTIAQQGDVPFLAVYDGSPSFAYRSRTHGDREVRRRLQEMEWQGKLFCGESDCRGFMAGHTFRLFKHHWFDDYDDRDNDFLLVTVEYEARNNYFGKGTDAVYRNEFVAIRRKIPYRPRLEHKPPRMAGPQTAIVVGPEGAEIHTDQFGRVKVQFHWDRYGKHDESSSCWVRVSQPLAGQGYGMIAIPRVGQEIIADFLDGNCDRPIVTGRVFNTDQPVPYGLPESASITGLRSRSTPGGGGFNELALHDAKGKELVSIHAHKDMFTSVGDSQMTVVNGKDQTVLVTNGSQRNMVKRDIEITSESGSILLCSHTELILSVGKSSLRFRPDGVLEIEGTLQQATSPRFLRTGTSPTSAAGYYAVSGAAPATVDDLSMLPTRLEGLELNSDQYLEAVKNGLWLRIVPGKKSGFRSNADVERIAESVKSTPHNSADSLSASPEVSAFVFSIAKPTAAAKINSKEELEKFITFGKNARGETVVTGIEVLGPNGGSPLIASTTIATAHVHHQDLHQPPHGADDDSVRRLGIPAFVIGATGDVVYEVGRRDGASAIRAILADGSVGRWEQFQTQANKYRHYRTGD